MKTLMISAMVVALLAVTYGLAAMPNSSKDPGDLKRQNADRVMSRAYGSNWVAVVYNNGRTNRDQQKVMIKLYKTALGYQQPCRPDL